MCYNIKNTFVSECRAKTDVASQDWRSDFWFVEKDSAASM
jgi:hypothetical protein